MIRAEGWSRVSFLKFQEGKVMEFSKVMHERRSVGFFDPNKPVSDALLKSVIETAALAPSGFNFQPWQLIVVKSPEEKEKLKNAAGKQPKITEAPVTLILLADKDGYKAGHPTMEKAWQNLVEIGAAKQEHRVGIEKGAAALYGGDEKSLMFAVKNAAFFGMAIMLAAKDAGVDSHPIDGFNHDAVRKTFEIPDNFVVPMLIALGYFQEGAVLPPRKWRKSYSEIVWKTC
jgi:nitroreductase